MEEDILEEQEEIILYVKNALDQIQQAKTKELKEHNLFSMLAYLISSSNKIAQNGDFYEAAGRLYSAAYYLEEFYPKEAQEVYSKANEYYINHLQKVIKEGDASEAANISIKISTIFKEKLHSPEEEQKYLQKAITLIENQIQIIGQLGSPRELCGKYQTLSMLYAKKGDWQKIIEINTNSMALAKAIKEYSLIFNAYHDIMKAYDSLGDFRKSENIIYEAMDFFSKEAELFEERQELLPLSQLYQIIKNIYHLLQNPLKFQIFSRKEAGVYIAMAKLGLLYNSSNAQIASYYRGAALCYRETNRNDIDSASCFFLAGNYYLEGKKHLEAALNYEDAAKIFQKLNNFKRAYELYMKAAEMAFKGKSLQSAIENFMWAYDMAIKEKIDPRKVLNLLIKSLNELASIEEVAQNYYVVATLKLEIASYVNNLPDTVKQTVDSYLESALSFYWKSLTQDSNISKKSAKIYIYAITNILAKFLGNQEIYLKTSETLHSFTSKNNSLYIDLTKIMIDAWDKKNPVDLNLLDKKIIKLFENSEELRILAEIMKIQINNIIVSPSSS